MRDYEKRHLNYAVTTVPWYVGQWMRQPLLFQGVRLLILFGTDWRAAPFSSVWPFFLKRRWTDFISESMNRFNFRVDEPISLTFVTSFFHFLHNTKNWFVSVIAKFLTCFEKNAQFFGSRSECTSGNMSVVDKSASKQTFAQIDWEVDATPFEFTGIRKNVWRTMLTKALQDTVLPKIGQNIGSCASF